MFAGESPECLLPILELIQTALPAEGKGRYAVGDEYSIADVVLGPFLARIEVLLKNDIGKYAEGLGVKTFAVLKEDPKFARYRQYSGELKERKVFKDTFDEVSFDNIRCEASLLIAPLNYRKFRGWLSPPVAISLGKNQLNRDGIWILSRAFLRLGWNISY